MGKKLASKNERKINLTGLTVSDILNIASADRWAEHLDWEKISIRLHVVVYRHHCLCELIRFDPIEYNRCANTDARRPL